MKFFLAQATARTIVLAALAVVVPCSFATAQSNGGELPPPSQLPPVEPPQQQPIPAPPTTEPDQQPHGKIIFERSTDENGQTTTTDGPAAPQNGQMVNAPTATDAERQSVTVSAYDMDVRLRTAERHIAVRALITVRNNGKAPLSQIPLQISSSLNWDRIRAADHDAVFTVATLNSDADHTGQLHEAAIALASPLIPGATIQLDVTYSGAIAPSAQRLLAIGTPDAAALHSDWDGIGVEFTGLRGFGNVVWYPVSSVPVILGDGARLFDEMGEHKLRNFGALFKLKLTVEFPHGRTPTVALINGHSVPLEATDAVGSGEEVPGVATAVLENATLGFEAPSLFVAVRTQQAASNTTLWYQPIDEAALQGWSAATAAVTPFLQGWLGEKPRSQLTILDLPDPADAPFETGAMLAVAIRPIAAEQLNGILAHALSHAFLRTATQAPPAWLDEGVAHFIGTLWLEKTDGRQKALEALEAARPALALAEPPSPGESMGQPLTEAISPIYYRSKATYVLWMLRDLAGDAALSAALRAYDPAQDQKKSASGSFEKLLEQATRRDLAWFFADWVNADKGLPDLTIEHVFPQTAQAGNWLVGVDLANAGYAAAEIPVTVHTAGTSITQRVLVPARSKVAQRILIQGQPTQVQANDGVVPETQASVHITDLTSSDNNATQSQPAAPQQ